MTETQVSKRNQTIESSLSRLRFADMVYEILVGSLSKKEPKEAWIEPNFQEHSINPTLQNIWLFRFQILMTALGI